MDDNSWEPVSISEIGKYEVSTYAGGYKSRIAVDCDEEVTASNEEEMAALVGAMGYDNVADFEKCTGRVVTELYGKWFLVMRDSVYVSSEQ